MEQTPGYHINPIIAGFYPDPAICRHGNDYYLVCSSFAWYPGLPLFHSTDLVNWKQLGYALDRPEQLDLTGVGVSAGLYAPSICFHQGLFYIVCTLVGTIGNFMITAEDPAGPWSQPVRFPELDGFDPSLFFDDNGKAYILYNSIPPGNIEMHWGHRTIRINEFDIARLKVISDNRILINGGTSMAAKPIWIEAPHIIKKDGWYYLICAEGGTGFDHSEVVFRSRSMDEPFLPYENNPILTQRTLDKDRNHPVTTAGHADFVETPEGKWYAVFLACRPYEGDHYNTGRETFMAPVEWIDGWPHINPRFETIQYRYPMYAGTTGEGRLLSGNHFFRDNFTADRLHMTYAFLRTVKESWFELQAGKKRLAMRLQPQAVSGKENPSFIGYRQMHLRGHAAVSLSFTPAAENEQAGLIVFQNENHYYFICQTLVEDQPVINLYKGAGNQNVGTAHELMRSIAIATCSEVFLQIVAGGSTYSFYYALKPGDWNLLAANVDARFLSTCTAGGFVGCMYGMYATSNGQASNTIAYYNWFENLNDDDVYKS